LGEYTTLVIVYRKINIYDRKRNIVPINYSVIVN